MKYKPESICSKCNRKGKEKSFGCYYTVDKETNKLVLKLACPECMEQVFEE